jgi:hypothetical protein
VRILRLSFSVRLLTDESQVAACWGWLRGLDKRELDELHGLLLGEKNLYETTDMDYHEAGVDCIDWITHHGGGLRMWEILYPVAGPS